MIEAAEREGKIHAGSTLVEATAGPLRDILGNAITEGDVVTFLDVHETCNNCYQCLVARQPTRCLPPCTKSCTAWRGVSCPSAVRA